MKLEEKLNLWVDITGINPTEERKSWTLSAHKISDYDIKKINDDLQNIIKYGNQVMTEIALRTFFIEFLKDRKVSLFDLISEENNNEMINKCKTLMQELPVTKEETAMKHTIKNALDFYGKDVVSEDINTFDLVSLYISAKNNIDNLKTFQFKRGNKSDAAPKILKEVYLFNSIDEVIKGINSFSENAIMLCYIHDTEESSGSYFSYVIKNEENIYLLGDIPEYEHPYQKYISRCPSRNMADRINKTYFPYSLTNIDLSDRYSVNDGFSKEDNFIPLGKCNSMELSELIWHIYMLQFIKEKFFDNSFDCPEISYTGNMLNTPLIEKSETALAIYNDFPVLDMPVYKDIKETDDLTYGNKNYPRNSQHLFDDVIDRFKDKISVEELQLYKNVDRVPLIEKKHWYDKDSADLLTVNTNSFGTAKELMEKSKWVLRFNYAIKINELAKQEYEEMNQDIRTWYHEMVNKNLPDIIEKTLRDEFKGKYKVIKNWNGTVTFGDGNDISLISKNSINEAPSSYYFVKNEYLSNSDSKCIISGAKGNICLTISPYDADNLCDILGITKDELPEQIRNWKTTKRNYSGNHLLDNLDPMDWVIKDYWYQMNFGIALVFSKSAYNKKRKEYGLSEDKFWKE